MSRWVDWIDSRIEHGFDDDDGTLKKFQGWWSPTFVYDYVIMAVILAMLAYSDSFFPFDVDVKLFRLSDNTLTRPLFEDQSEISEVLLMSVIPTFFIYCVFFVKKTARNYYRSGPVGKRKFSFVHVDLEEAHALVLTLIGAVGLANFFFFVIKDAVRRPRPDTISRCAPACFENVTWRCVSIDQYVDESLCPDPTCCPEQCDYFDPRTIGNEVANCSFIQNGEDIRSSTLQTLCATLWDRYITPEQANCRGSPGDGGYSPYTIDVAFTSFPSGHALSITGVYTFVWLYLAGKLQVYGPNVNQRQFFWGFASMSFGILMAMWVALSRVSDYKHHPLDALAGMIIGFVPMLFVYPLYWQSPFQGGEPLRRPKRKCRTCLSHIWCDERYLEQPWPKRTYLPRTNDFSEAMLDDLESDEQNGETSSMRKTSATSEDADASKVTQV